MKALIKLSIGLLVAAAISGCQTSNKMLVTTKNGTQLALSSIPALGQVRADGVSEAYSQKRFFAVPNNQLCPKYWAYSSSATDAILRCDSIVKRQMPEHKSMLETGCDCVIAFGPDRKLLVDPERFRNPYRHSPMNMMIQSPDGDRVYLVGITEFERSGLGQQKISLYDPKENLVCTGTAEFKLLTDGSFNLKCFDGSITGQGVVGLMNVRQSNEHSVGSGVLSNGNKFVFVTGLSSISAKLEYPEYFSGIK